MPERLMPHREGENFISGGEEDRQFAGLTHDLFDMMWDRGMSIPEIREQMALIRSSAEVADQVFAELPPLDLGADSLVSS